MEDYIHLTEKYEAILKEKITELHKICLSEWEVYNTSVGIEDRAIDVAEEILNNIIVKDRAFHYYSSERPRAVEVECYPNVVRVKVKLYYSFDIIAYIDAMIQDDGELRVAYDVWRE